MCLKVTSEEKETKFEFAYLKEISNPYLFKIYFHESIIYDISMEEFETMINTLSIRIFTQESELTDFEIYLKTNLTSKIIYLLINYLSNRKTSSNMTITI